LFGPEPSRLIFEDGPLQLPNPTAVSAWEDPTTLIFTKWSFLESTTNFWHQLYLIKINLISFYRLLIEFSIFSPILILSVFFLINRLSLKSKAHFCSLIVVTVLLVLGLLPIRIESRYVWFVQLFLLITSGILLEKIRPKMTSPMFRFITIVLLGSFMLYPLKQLQGIKYRNKMSYDMSQTLKACCITRPSVFASSANWGDSLYLSFHLDSAYLMQTKPDLTGKDLLNELHVHGATHYLVWNESEVEKQLFSAYNNIAKNTIPGLSVYDLKQTKD
jgi:hypothetical protein